MTDKELVDEADSCIQMCCLLLQNRKPDNIEEVHKRLRRMLYKLDQHKGRA